MAKIINTVVLCILFINGFAQKNMGELLYKNTRYSIGIYPTISQSGDSLVEDGFYFHYSFINEMYSLVIEYHIDSTFKSITGNNIKRRMGLDFSLDDKGRITYVKFEVLGIESGPEIYFYSNGLIKSYYNYGFKNRDLKLPEKEREVIIKDFLITARAYEIYYKEKNGIEYHFSETGQLVRMDYWKNDKIVRSDTLN